MENTMDTVNGDKVVTTLKLPVIGPRGNPAEVVICEKGGGSYFVYVRSYCERTQTGEVYTVTTWPLEADNLTEAIGQLAKLATKELADLIGGEWPYKWTSNNHGQ